MRNDKGKEETRMSVVGGASKKGETRARTQVSLNKIARDVKNNHNFLRERDGIKTTLTTMRNVDRERETMRLAIRKRERESDARAPTRGN